MAFSQKDSSVDCDGELASVVEEQDDDVKTSVTSVSSWGFKSRRERDA